MLGFALVFHRGKPRGNPGGPGPVFALVAALVEPRGDTTSLVSPWFIPGEMLVGTLPGPALVLPWGSMDLPWVDAMLRYNAIGHE